VNLPGPIVTSTQFALLLRFHVDVQIILAVLARVYQKLVRL
jgi:hypothetical protein